MFGNVQFSVSEHAQVSVHSMWSSCREGRTYLCRCSSRFLRSLVDSFQPQWEFFVCITDKWEIMTCTAVHRFWSVKHFNVVSTHKTLSLAVWFILLSQWSSRRLRYLSGFRCHLLKLTSKSISSLESPKHWQSFVFSAGTMSCYSLHENISMSVCADEKCPTLALQTHYMTKNDSRVCVCTCLWDWCTRACGEAAIIILFVMPWHSGTDTDPRQQGPDPALIKPTALLL